MNDVTIDVLNPVTQVKSADRVSQRYKFIPTTKVLEVLARLGWKVTSEVITKPRKESRKGFQKHMIRLSNDAYYWDEYNKPELVLVNSHDGLSSLKIMLGVFRMVCSNGLIAMKSGEMGRVIHKGDVESNLKDVISTVMEKSKVKQREVLTMRSTQLDGDALRRYALETALAVLPKDAIATDDTYNRLARVRRMADKHLDLWTVFNVFQENVIKHGLPYVKKNEETGRYDKHSTRAIRGVTSLARTNMTLWAIAEKQVNKAA